MSGGDNPIQAFQYTALPARVLFGFGTISKVRDELISLGCKKAFVLSDPHHATGAAARLMQVLGELGVGLSMDAVMHTPADVTERVAEKIAVSDADCLVALGGGLRAEFEAHRELIEAIPSEQFDQTSTRETRLVRIFAKHIPSSRAQK
jgi:Iron-containing alcohol dehydrogenase